MHRGPVSLCSNCGIHSTTDCWAYEDVRVLEARGPEGQHGTELTTRKRAAASATLSQVIGEEDEMSRRVIALPYSRDPGVVRARR